MLDTNTFDYIFDQNILPIVSSLINSEFISLVICRVQIDEIDKISDAQKKQFIENIPCEKIPTSIGYVGVEDRYNRGYLAPRVDWCKAVDDEDAKLVNKYRRGRTESHPVGNEGDLSIVFTAIKENLDFLVSDDSEVQRIFEGLKSDFDSELKFLDNESFKDKMNKWISTV